MKYHIIIVEENREWNDIDPRPLAIKINSSDEEGNITSTQLHSMCDELPDLDDDRILYCASDDGVVHKNLVGEINMVYSGWDV